MDVVFMYEYKNDLFILHFYPQTPCKNSFMMNVKVNAIQKLPYKGFYVKNEILILTQNRIKRTNARVYVLQSHI